MKISTNKGKMYSVSTKTFLKKIVDFIKPYIKKAIRAIMIFISSLLVQAERYLLKKIDEWEVEVEESL